MLNLNNFMITIIDKFNTAQHTNNMHYLTWLLIKNVETPPQLTISRPTITATANTTTRRSSDNPSVDSGMDTVGLRRLFNTSQQVTSPSKTFRPSKSTPYPRGPLSYPQTPHSPPTIGI